MDVVWIFIECVSSLQRDLLAALELHDKRSLEHVYEHVRIVPMCYRRGAGRELDQRDSAFLFRTGEAGKRLRHQRGYLGFLSERHRRLEYREWNRCGHEPAKLRGHIGISFLERACEVLVAVRCRPYCSSPHII